MKVPPLCIESLCSSCNILYHETFNFYKWNLKHLILHTDSPVMAAVLSGTEYLCFLLETLKFLWFGVWFSHKALLESLSHHGVMAFLQMKGSNNVQKRTLESVCNRVKKKKKTKLHNNTIIWDEEQVGAHSCYRWGKKDIWIHPKVSEEFLQPDSQLHGCRWKGKWGDRGHLLKRRSKKFPGNLAS